MTDCRNPKGEPFGLEGIKGLLGGYANLSAQEICDRMLQTLIDYQQGSKQDDDVTLVAVHAKEKWNYSSKARFIPRQRLFQFLSKPPMMG
ncbi:MAG: SpoIIE family protein phosphatase [Chloroflexi bacterium]|nr:SpoIIE family protein phosphatase [Chloroflexota bacterium]